VKTPGPLLTFSRGDTGHVGGPKTKLWGELLDRVCATVPLIGGGFHAGPLFEAEPSLPFPLNFYGGKLGVCLGRRGRGEASDINRKFNPNWGSEKDTRKIKGKVGFPLANQRPYRPSEN